MKTKRKKRAPTHDPYKDIRRDIKKYGQHLIGVAGDREGPPFIYTIGNTEKGLPELLLIGAADSGIGKALNLLGEKMRERGERFTNGELVDAGGKCKLLVVDASSTAKEKYTTQAGQFYLDQNYTVQQVVIPDQQCVFPDEPGCAKPYADLPMLGKRKVETGN